MRPAGSTLLPGRTQSRASPLLQGGLLLALLLVCTQSQALTLTGQEQAGQRLYRQGLASSDAQLQAQVGPSGIRVPASVLPCASCHGRDGSGRPEGGVRPPSLHWQRLALGQGERQVNGRRYPAYTAASLAKAIRSGVDPAGNRLDPAMPRFDLTLADQRNLTAYLKRLADERDPGLEDQVLRLGTLLPESGPLAEAGRVVRAVLEDGIEQLNRQGGLHGRRLELQVADPGTSAASTSQALAGLAQRQVFALVAPLAPWLDSGALAGEGLPLVGATPLDGGGPQVFDPLPALPEQLLSVAVHAREVLGLQSLQVVFAGQDQALAAGRLLERMRQLGHNPPPAQPFEGRAVAGEGIVFLGSPRAFAELAAALEREGRQPYLLAASAQVAGALPGLSAHWSQRLLLAYPFAPSDWRAAGREALQGVRQRQGLDGRQAALQVSTLCAWQVLVEALRQVGRDASREGLIAALEQLHGVDTGLTPALGFGPGRRQGLAGAHVVQVSLPGPGFTEVAPYRAAPQVP